MAFWAGVQRLSTNRPVLAEPVGRKSVADQIKLGESWAQRVLPVLKAGRAWHSWDPSFPNRVYSALGAKLSPQLIVIVLEYCFVLSSTAARRLRDEVTCVGARHTANVPCVRARGPVQKAWSKCVGTLAKCHRPPLTRTTSPLAWMGRRAVAAIRSFVDAVSEDFEAPLVAVCLRPSLTVSRLVYGLSEDMVRLRALAYLLKVKCRDSDDGKLAPTDILVLHLWLNFGAMLRDFSAFLAGDTSAEWPPRPGCRVLARMAGWHSNLKSSSLLWEAHIRSVDADRKLASVEYSDGDTWTQTPWSSIYPLTDRLPCRLEWCVQSFVTVAVKSGNNDAQ